MPKLVSNSRCIPYNPELVVLAKKNRNQMTPQERKLWYFLKFLQPRFLRQRPIVYYIADFYCPQLKLIIEVDGQQHGTSDNRAGDAERTKVLNDFGVSVIRFTNAEIDNNFTAVTHAIKTHLTNGTIS